MGQLLLITMDELESIPSLASSNNGGFQIKIKVREKDERVEGSYTAGRIGLQEKDIL